MADHLQLNPARTALVNVDMQRCFVENSPLAAPDGPELVRRLNELIRVCRQTGTLVVHTRGWMRADGSDVGPVMSELVPPFIVALYTEGADSAQLHDDLDVAPEDVIIDKSRYGAFHGTALESTLHARGIDTVIITGIATNICCETTAREAAQRDFRVLFLRDGTATKEMNGISADDLQRATCASLGMVFARIADIDEVTGALLAAREPMPST
ncbi:MAG TPA: isochorismatase family cysteine hydrolase [Mycobacteriales bacterium]|jgi:ureidoacrylate peracid hydrolase|nr:isochorismatase family cysteine hydrolase [Mycobacteriales bacterium]